MMSGKLKYVLKNQKKLTVILGLSTAIYVTGCFKPAASLYLEDKSVVASERQENTVGTEGVSFSLDLRTENSINRYGSIIKKYSERYGLDWRLVLAIMKQESRFRHDAVSHRGAYGLMQIMPVTQIELAQKLGVEETISPYNNIRAGAFHLRTLLKMFEEADEENRIKISLAAYNAGLSRILDAQDIAAYLGDDPYDWNAVRAALPLLTRRHYTLHKNVWEDGRPRAGFFRDWQQTSNYVSSIMEYYREYKFALL